MKKNLVSYCYVLSSFLLIFALSLSCSSPESKAPDGAYASSAEVTEEVAPAPEETTEEAYRPLLWEIKWASKRVLDFGVNYEKVCKTEFTNPYKKVIKEIVIGYEVKEEGETEPENFQKTIELNLKPGQSKVVDTGVGCNDFFMFEVRFADGSMI